MIYFYCWSLFVITRASYLGYKDYRVNRDAGYNIIQFEQTGERVEFHGGFGETFSCTLVGALRLLLTPAFLISATFYFLPAAFLLFFLSSKAK